MIGYLFETLSSSFTDNWEQFVLIALGFGVVYGVGLFRKIK